MRLYFCMLGLGVAALCATRLPPPQPPAGLGRDVPFGRVAGEDRGVGAMTAPLMLHDPFYGLRQPSAATRAYIFAENKHYAAHFAARAGAVAELERRLHEVLPPTDATPPAARSPGGGRRALRVVPMAPGSEELLEARFEDYPGAAPIPRVAAACWGADDESVFFLASDGGLFYSSVVAGQDHDRCIVPPADGFQRLSDRWLLAFAGQRSWLVDMSTREVRPVRADLRLEDRAAVAAGQLWFADEDGHLRCAPPEAPEASRVALACGVVAKVAAAAAGGDGDGTLLLQGEALPALFDPASGAVADVPDLRPSDQFRVRAEEGTIVALREHPLKPAELQAFDVATRRWGPPQPAYRAPRGYDPRDYVHEEREIGGVPCTVVQHRSRAQPAALVEVYGGFGVPLHTQFRPELLPLLERGVAVVWAHVRGSGGRGRAWHHAGRLARKARGVDDLVAVGEALAAEGAAVAAVGASVGGTLVLAAGNERPRLWAALLARVPAADQLNSVADPSVAHRSSHWSEFGNPNDKRYFDVVREYCPYQNVGAHFAAPVLLTAGLHDERVPFWEPLKFVARLRASGAPALALLRVAEAGHHGAVTREAAIRELAEEWAFVLEGLGLLEG